MKRLFIIPLLLIPVLCSSQWLNQRTVYSAVICYDVVDSWNGNFVGVGEYYFEEFDSLNTIIHSESIEFGRVYNVLKSKPDNYLLVSFDKP